MTAERFEQLRIWQNARLQTNNIYKVFGTTASGSKDYSFRNQLQRCAVSVMNNIAEGFERKTDPEFARFLDIAKGSNGEVRSMLYLAEDLQYIPPDLGEKMRAFSEELSKAIESLSKHLRK